MLKNQNFVNCLTLPALLFVSWTGGRLSEARMTRRMMRMTTTRLSPRQMSANTDWPRFVCTQHNFTAAVVSQTGLATRPDQARLF